MNNNLTIGITGATGHVGSQLSNHLKKRGLRVIKLIRNPGIDESFSSRMFDLTQPIADDLLIGIDILIHCAFVANAQSEEAKIININGSRNLFESCRKQGVKII